MIHTNFFKTKSPHFLKAKTRTILRKGAVCCSLCLFLPLASGCAVQRSIVSNAEALKTNASSMKDRLTLRKIRKKVLQGDVEGAREDLSGLILPAYVCKGELLLAESEYAEDPDSILSEVDHIEEKIWMIPSPEWRVLPMMDLAGFFFKTGVNIEKGLTILAQIEDSVSSIRNGSLRRQREEEVSRFKDSYNHVLMRHGYQTVHEKFIKRLMIGDKK